MIQLGIDKKVKSFIGALCLLLAFTGCSKTPSFQETEGERFQEARVVLVETVFFEQDKYDPISIERVIASSLQQIGREQTRLDRPTIERTDGLLSIVINPVAESGANSGYPILQLSMKLIVPVCFPKKPMVMVSGRLWEADRFVGIEGQNTTTKIEESIRQMLHELGDLYEKANACPLFVISS